MTTRLAIDVQMVRGDAVESRHQIEAAVVRVDGTAVAVTADPDQTTTFRSAAKPFQLLPLVERGHADRWGFADEDLAVMAASHTGSPAHVERVSGILARIGLGERDLACGIHDPQDPISLDHVRRHPEAASPLYNNCSGKHAGMLALALAEGWPTHGYQHADHPVQQLMRRTIAEVCGMETEAVGIAVDGCSVSVFIVPLSRMARAWARLAVARPAGDARERALDRIRGAMVAHPRATSGAGQFSAELMERTAGRVVAKGGAEGLQCLAVPQQGLGIALKCEDGAGRAVGPATVALLEQIGVLTPAERVALEGWGRTVVRNHAGLEVGYVSAQLRVREAMEV